MATPRRLMLLDSASLYFRAFYGVPDQREHPGEPPTNAVRGFLDMIASLVDRFRPQDIVACWDNDWRPAFRVEAIPSYKTHRVADPTTDPDAEEVPDDLSPQVPVIVHALRALGIPRIGIDGFEADDVIGALTLNHRGQGPVDIVTGDRDLFQLVDDASQVRVLYTARGGVRDADHVDQAFLAAKYGVPSGAAYADLAVLRGDSSDGLPGVAGIGEKTAASLLAIFGTLDQIQAALAAGDPRIKGAVRTRLEAGSAYLQVAPAVVRVASHAPLPATPGRPGELPRAVADPVLLSRLAVDYRLTSSLNRVISALDLD